MEVDGSASQIIAPIPESIGLFPAAVIVTHGGSLDVFELDLADILATDGYTAAASDIFYRQESCNDLAASRTSVSFTRCGFCELYCRRQTVDCQYRQG